MDYHRIIIKTVRLLYNSACGNPCLGHKVVYVCAYLKQAAAAAAENHKAARLLNILMNEFDQSGFRKKCKEAEAVYKKAL